MIGLPRCVALFPSNNDTGSCPRNNLLARHVCAQCMTVDSVVHKTLSVLHVLLWNVVCTVFYTGGKHRLSCYRKNMGWGCLRAGCMGRYLGLRRVK